MSDLFSKFEPGEMIGLVAVAGGIMIPLVCGALAIITDYWHKVHQLALKQDMLNRGMCADDIRTVLDAGTKRSARELRASAADR